MHCGKKINICHFQAKYLIASKLFPSIMATSNTEMMTVPSVTMISKAPADYDEHLLQVRKSWLFITTEILGLFVIAA